MEGPPCVNHLKFQEDFGVAPVIGVSGVATTGRIWVESQKIPLVIGGTRTGDLTVSDLAVSLLTGVRLALYVTGYQAGIALYKKITKTSVTVIPVQAGVAQ